MKTLEYKVSYEKMISRISGLFAYVDFNELGEKELHKATDSEDGCFGKIVENIKYPYYDFTDPEDESIVLIKQGNTYSYHTLMRYYYIYKDVLKEEDLFKKFIEEGIGKMELVNPDKKVFDLMPEYIYLANARSEFNKMRRMKKMCDFYNQKIEEAKAEGKTENEYQEMCCECDKFRRMGGNDYIDVLEVMVILADQTAETYLQYADTENEMTLDIDLFLTSSENDLGIVSTNVVDWQPDVLYKEGDRVYYDEKVYVCINENSGKYNPQIEITEFDYDSFTELKDYFLNKTVGVSGESFKDLSDDAYFENGEIKDEFSKVEGQSDSKLKSLRRTVNWRNIEDVQEIPDKNKYDWLYFYRLGQVRNERYLRDDNGNILRITGENETNEGDFVVTNEAAESGDGNNLAAFGDYISNISVSGTELTFEYVIGAHLQADYATGEMEDDVMLHYWNNFKIDTNSDFDKYGVHYTETYNFSSSGDLQKLVSGDIEITVNGVAERLTGDVFGDYIAGKYDGLLDSYKFEFNVGNSSKSLKEKVNFYDVYYDVVSSDYKIDRKKSDINDFIFNNLQVGYIPDKNVELDEEQTHNINENIREEYYNGITYTPERDIEVSINRGVTSVFEKHLRFGEVKTLEDMENFQNSSFFKFSETLNYEKTANFYNNKRRT